MAGDRDALQQRLRALFAVELEDNVRVLNAGVVRLEQLVRAGEAPAELIQELFRAAHSVKGAAHSAGVLDAVGAAHRLEDGLARLRDNPESRDEELVSGLLADVDALSDVLAELTTGAERHETDDAASEGLLESREAPAATAAQVRVATADIDAVVMLAGEVVAASRRVQLLARAAADRSPAGPGADGARADQHRQDAALAQSSRDVARSGTLLAGAAQRLTFLAFGDLCAGLDRTVRDLAQDSGKQARLVIVGDGIEVDRAVATALREPLLHLVRNAVDHGLEDRDRRRHAGKPETGVVTVSARLRHGVLEVAVADDGRGVDLDALRGMVEAQASEGGADTAALAFAPGVSTARSVSHISGRGVGLDAVRARVEGVGGTVRLASTPGSGTTVTLTAPVSLALLRVVLLGVGTETLCLPHAAIERLVTVDTGDLRRVDEKSALDAGERMWPVVPLTALLDLPAGRQEGALAVALVDTGSGAVALAADSLVGEAEVVLKPLPARAAGLAELLGAAVLADGRAALVLNPTVCVRRALASDASIAAPPTAPQRRRPRVLLAEDTLTTRALERSILEGGGYEVMVAVDGSEAWELLQRHGADVLVSDVHMPRMDGIALCSAVRRSERFRDLPVVLVTSLGSDEDRRRGVEAGATAYIVKGEFQRDALLNAVARVL